MTLMARSGCKQITSPRMGKRTGMGTFRITVELADPLGQHFEAVEMLVDTGATFTLRS